MQKKINKMKEAERMGRTINHFDMSRCKGTMCILKRTLELANRVLEMGCNGDDEASEAFSDLKRHLPSCTVNSLQREMEAYDEESLQVDVDFIANWYADQMGL